jgi:hypothetical protein
VFFQVIVEIGWRSSHPLSTPLTARREASFLRRDMDELKAEVARLAAENAALKADNATLKAENGRLVGKLAVMEKSFADLIGKFGAARAEAAVSGAAAATGGGVGAGTAQPPGAGATGPSGSGAQTPPSALSSLFKGKTVKHRSKEAGGRFGTMGATPTAADTFAVQRSQSMIDDDSTRRRSQTVDSRQLGSQGLQSIRVSNTVISPRDVDAEVLHKAWGVALRDHFDSGVTVPSAVSQLVSHIKQFVLHSDDAGAMAGGKKGVLFANLPAQEDARLRGLLEFGDSVPAGTPVESSCQLLLSFLNSLPDPVIGPESAQLLVEAHACTDPEYVGQGRWVEALILFFSVINCTLCGASFSRLCRTTIACCCSCSFRFSRA